jgi:hypothetical protein
MRAFPLVAAALVVAAACAPAAERAADSAVAADSVAPPRDIVPAAGVADSAAAPGGDSAPSAPAGPAPAGGAPAGRTPAARPSNPDAGSANVEPQRPQGGIAVRGVVRLAGSAPTQRLVLRREDGSTLPLEGASLTALRRVGGTEVEARGVMQGESFAVSSFTVVAADGAPARDGVLERSGESLVLRTATGRVTLGNPPSALRAQVGARVWITGDPATGPNAYGIIEPK